VAAVAAQAGRRRFHAAVMADVEQLLAHAEKGVGGDALASRRDALPEPIQRYLRYAISPAAPAIRTMRLEHDGLFRTGPGQSWLPIAGEEIFTAATPGFVWHATVRPAPWLWIEARDRLLDDRGNMLVKLLSMIPIADASGREIDQGARLRWLAEAAWFPYAWVGDSIAWEPIDGSQARVTLRCEGLPVTGIVQVDADGRLVTFSAPRYRDTGHGTAVLTPWTGHYGDYREFSGVRLPASVDVAWELDAGPFSYARFRLTSVEFNPTLAAAARTHPS
jgi:hypothetical protein